MKNKKKMLLLMSACLLLVSCKDSKKIEDPIYDVPSYLSKPYATYSMGNIYIGNKEYLQGLSNLSKYDILIEDQRTNKNPNMRIYDSYTVYDPNVRREILEVICNYEKEDPSEWERSIPSMESEWYFHNVSYFLSIQKERTKDVDLDNDAEYKYNNSIMKKITK